MTIATTIDVLLVDDEPQVREIVANYLARDGFQVRSASDGEEALQSIASQCPDAIVLDLMLPKVCLLYTSPSPRDATLSRMPSSA